MKHQHYYVQNQKQRQSIQKAKTNVASKDRTPLQTPNLFASWDPLLQMLCDPLSTKVMERTFHFRQNHKGRQMIEFDNGKMMKIRAIRSYNL